MYTEQKLTKKTISNNTRKIISMLTNNLGHEFDAVLDIPTWNYVSKAYSLQLTSKSVAFVEIPSHSK